VIAAAARGLASAVLVIALGACTTSSGPAAAPGRDLLSWQGATVGELEQALGRPDNSYALSSGERVLAYRWSRSETTGGYAVSMGGYSQLGTQYVPTQVVTLNCIARFTLGPDDRIKSTDLQGSGCFADHR